MKFAVSLVRLLCGLVAGVLLVAYLYFTINYEQTGVAGSHTLALACLFLFVAALLIWGGLAVMSDVWLKRIDNKEFYHKLLQKGQLNGITSDLMAGNTQQLGELLKQISATNEDSKQTLLSGLYELGEKLQALKNEKMSEDQNTLVGEVRAISQNMNEVQTQIETLLTQLQQQKKILSQLSDYPSRMNNGETKYYPVLQEEADYPESVIDYNESQSNVDVIANSDTGEQEPKLEETSVADDAKMVTEITEDDVPLDEFMDESLDDLLNEEAETSDDNSNSLQDLPKEDESVDFSEDVFDVDNTTLDLEDASPDFTSALSETTENVDLGADNPFGTEDLAPNASETEINFEPSQEIDLGADNPFGEEETKEEAEIDIKAVEPAVSAKKNEPNLEQIFNDELASELADLEILNGKPTEKTQDDIDLEQFFAGYRKSMDQQ